MFQLGRAAVFHPEFIRDLELTTIRADTGLVRFALPFQL